MNKKSNIVILGPTATGKTKLAAIVASMVNGEVISADSRQVYRGMDLGTGKDMIDYLVDGKMINSHLIDIAEAGSQYSIYNYLHDFAIAANNIQAAKKTIVVCGGSGMYLEAALGLYHFADAPVDEQFRRETELMTEDDLFHMLAALKPLHNTTDTRDRNRMIRAIEVARADTLNNHSNGKSNPSPVSLENSLIFGIDLPREEIRRRITERLELRLKEGMLNEVHALLNKGIHPENLSYYGLEYKYMTHHLTGKLTYDEMFSLLNTAIHQFAKRQMTWFRRMEKKGIPIHWLNGNLSPEDNAGLIITLFNNL